MYFVATQFSDYRIQELFDAARLVTEGDYASRAHITLRGPYKSKSDISKSVFEKQPEHIIVRKPGNFFNERQSTVHLEVEILDITDLWYKPDYPAGTPHLTIYDGKDRRFAWGVFATLRRHRWKLSLNSSRLSVLEKKRTVEDDFLDASRFPAELLERVVGRRLSAQDVRALPELERLAFLNLICSEIQRVSHPS